jgi:hypothetical protein
MYSLLRHNACIQYPSTEIYLLVSLAHTRVITGMDQRSGGGRGHDVEVDVQELVDGTEVGTVPDLEGGGVGKEENVPRVR